MTQPQNVLLDGQDLRDQGMMIGDPVVEKCEILGNNSDPWDGAVELEDGSWCDMVDSLVADNAGGGISVADNSHLELIGTTVSGNLGVGVEVVRGSDLLLKNATINGNGSAGVYARLSEVHAYPDDGGAQITDNLYGVYAGANSLIDFHGQAGIVIQANTNGDMVAQSHRTIQGYGNGTVGSYMEADSHAMCNP